MLIILENLFVDCHFLFVYKFTYFVIRQLLNFLEVMKQLMLKREKEIKKEK